MTRRRKKCRCCRKLFRPHPQTYRQQITCSKRSCRAWRRRRAQSVWRANNPLYGDSRTAKQQAWRAAHAGYWRAWRARHPAYVTKNRQAQKRRDATKRENLAKQNEWSRVQREKTVQKARLHDLAKRDEWPRFIDGICRYMILAKQNDMALSALVLQE